MTWYVILSKLNELNRKEHKIVEKGHDKKLRELCNKRIIQDSFEPDKLIFNFTDKVLTENQKSVLMKGLNFSLPPGKVDEIEIFAAFETCYGGIKGLRLNEENTTHERFRNKFSEQAYSYCQHYKVKTEKNMTDDELKGLHELRKDRSIKFPKLTKETVCTAMQK